jgi:hypothetical protein
VQPELELGDHPEVAAAATQTPEQVRTLGGGGAHDLTFGGHQRVGLDVVAGQPELPGEPAHASAQREPANAGMGDVAGGRGQAVRVGREVERAQQRAALDRRAPPGRVDLHAVEEPQVDLKAAVGHGQARDAVAAALDADLHPAPPPVPDDRHDILGRGATRDKRRAPVERGIPDLAARVVAVITGRQHGAREARDGGR